MFFSFDYVIKEMVNVAAVQPFLNFIFGVQGNGMGFLTILRTRKILIVLSGHFLMIYFIQNNSECILNDFECILNLIELL